MAGNNMTGIFDASSNTGSVLHDYIFAPTLREL